MSSVKEVQAHFDGIAKDYDYYKKKNWYYYQNLKEFFAGLIPPGSSVLEIGCGTGALLHHVRPKRGLGIDSSRAMLEIARKRFPELEFRQIPAEELQGKEKFDYLVMADVVEHLSNLEQALAKTAGCCRKGSVLIITSINPVWEPILDLAERLGLKMPEGPHDWPGQERLRQLLERQGFQARSTGYRLLIPKHVPFLSDYANKHFARVPFLRGLGVIQFLVAEFKP